MRAWLAAAALAALLALGPQGAPAGGIVPEPDGYRMDDFRAPVPATLEGGTVVDDAAAFALWSEGRTLFVDVLPRPPKPANLPEGTIWRDKPRHSIPGAIWLPNVGYGALAEATDAWFREALARATGGDKAHPVLFFCLAECWMSWNAAKRAIEDYGYSTVYWYPDGTDGWSFAGHPTAELKPEPGP